MLIDLTVPFNEKTPNYPGDSMPSIESVGVLSRDGYQDHFVCCGTHVGTHMDAPSHMVEGGLNLSQVRLEQVTGPAICLPINGSFSLEALESADIREGDIVFFYTGMGERYHEEAYFQDYPALTPEIAKYLVGKGVKLIGTDTCSPDGQEPGFPIHKILLGNGVIIIENLTNLEQVVGKRFEAYAFPAKYDLDGGPVRVVARM